MWRAFLICHLLIRPRHIDKTYINAEEIVDILQVSFSASFESLRVIPLCRLDSFKTIFAFDSGFGISCFVFSCEKQR